MPRCSFTRAVSFALLGLAVFLGLGSFLLLFVFLFAGSLQLVDLSFGYSPALLVDVLLCLAFFVQHSVMIRPSVRRRALGAIQVPYHGALFTVASALVLLALVVFWQESPPVLVELQGVARILTHLCFALAIAGIIWGLVALRSFDMFGAGALLSHLRNESPAELPVAVRGPYRWVRHPLYAFMLLAIWSCPRLTADRLLLDILFTIWVVVGSLLEERNLVSELGEPYRRYQTRVPMLFPWRLRPYREE